MTVLAWLLAIVIAIVVIAIAVMFLNCFIANRPATSRWCGLASAASAS